MKKVKLMHTDVVVTMTDSDFMLLCASLNSKPKLLERVKARARSVTAAELIMADMMEPPK